MPKDYWGGLQVCWWL